MRALGGRATGRTRREAPAGRAPRRRPGRGGQAVASRTFVRVESPPRGLGLCGRPRPQPRLLPGDVYLVCGVRSRRAGGAEFRVRGTSRGAGERQDVRQSRGRQGERLRGGQGRSVASAGGRPPASGLRPALLPAGCCPGAGGGSGWAGLAVAVGRSEPRGRAGGGLGGGGGRAELRSGAGASLPASVPGSGSRRARTRNRSAAGKLVDGSGFCGNSGRACGGREIGVWGATSRKPVAAVFGGVVGHRRNRVVSI